MCKILFYGLTFIIAFTNAQIPGIGNCPRVQVIQQTFDISQFMGTWYLICAYPAKFALDGKCVSTTFTLAPNNAGINIFSKHVSLGNEKKFMGTASIYGNGILAVTYQATPKADGYYNILDTDYANYAVIFSCNNFYGIVSSQNLWVLGRRRFLEPMYLDKAMNVINMNGLSRFALKHIDQNCENPYPYPYGNNNFS